MKNIEKKVLAFVAVMVLSLCVGVSAFATETPRTQENQVVTVSDNAISPQSNHYEEGVPISSTKWTTIATSTSGFNRNVKVSTLNTIVASTNHIRMLGKDNNVVWQENNAIGFSSSRVFWCGSDVYKIQIRCSSGAGSAYCSPSN